MTDKKCIFISYARHDGFEHAQQLERFLKDNDYNVWIDARGVRDGHDYSVEIEEGIKGAACVVVCITPSIETHKGGFVRREVMYAEAVAHKTIIPLIYPGGKPFVNITHLNWIAVGTTPEGDPHYDVAFKELLHRLENLEAEAPRSEPRVKPDPFRPYLATLYEHIVSFLKDTVHSSLLTLQSQEAPDQVATHAMPMAFIDFWKKTSLPVDPTEETVPQNYANFEDAFHSIGGRLLLLGDPGAGKTTTLFAFARDAILRRLEDPEHNPLPIFAPIAAWEPDWNEEWGPENLPKLVDWLCTDLPGMKPEVTKEILNGRALLLLDALDELGSERKASHRKSSEAWGGGESALAARREDREGADSRPKDASQEQKIVRSYNPRELFVRCFNEQFPESTQVVISCRIKDYDTLADKLALNRAIHLRELTNEQIQAYLNRLPDLWEALLTHPDLLKTARNPLLLSLFTIAFKGLDEEMRQLKDLSQGDLRDAIFSKYVTKRYEREEKKLSVLGRQLDFSPEALADLLGQIALDNLNRGDKTENVLKDSDIALVIPDEARRKAFIRQAVLLNILVQFQAETYRFIHLLMRDYFAYEAAIRLFKYAENQKQKASAADGLARLGDPRAFSLLAQSLVTLSDDEFARTRTAIVRALAKSQDESAAEALIGALADSNADVRRAAAESLGERREPDAVYPLIDTLQDDSPYVRGAAAQSLGEIGDTAAIEPLIVLLEDRGRYRFMPVSQWAADALIAIGEPALEPLLEALASETDERREMAVYALGKLAHERAVEPLLAALNDPNARVRRRAIYALGRLDIVAAVPTLISLLHDPDCDVRRAAVETLGQFRDSQAALPLIAVLGDEDGDVRAAAAEALPAFGEQVLDPLLDMLKDTAPDTRAQVLIVLGQLADARATEPLVGLLADENEDIRCRAATALGKIGEAHAVLPLIDALQDTSAGVRINVIEALASLDDPRAVLPLIPLLLVDETAAWDDDPVYQIAQKALVSFKNFAVDPLIETLKDENPIMRARAADTLGRLGHVKAVMPLIKLLNDPQTEVRLAAVEALGHLKDSRSTQRLANVLLNAQEEEKVRGAAAKALAASERTSAVAPLFSALHDSSDTVRLAALEGLGSLDMLDSPEASAPLESMLQAPDAKLRIAAAKALARRKDLRAVEPLIYLLRDSAISDDNERGRIFDVLDDLVKATLPPEHGLAYLCRGLDHLIDGDYEQAHHDLTQAIHADPDKWYHHYWHAELTAWLDRDYEQILKDCNRALELNDHLPFAYSERGLAHNRLKQYDEAISDSLKAIELDPAHASAYLQLGIAYHNQKHYEDAIRELSRAIEIQPKDGGFYNWRGSTYYEMKNYPAALDDLTQALKLRSDMPYDYYWRGWTYHQMGQYTQAIADFTKALELDPGNADHYASRCRSYWQLRDYPAAFADIAKTIELDPPDKSHYWLKGNLHLALGEFSEAFAAYTQELNITHEEIDYYFLAVAAIGVGDYVLALDTMLKADKPGDAMFMAYDDFWRGVIHELQGHTDDAHAYYAQAMTYSIGIAEADSQHRVQALMTLKAGQVDIARTHYQQMLNINSLRHKIETPPLYLRVLAHVFPDRADIQAMYEWLEASLTTAEAD